MSQLRTDVYQYFQTDDIPSEEQFQYTWNSIWFKDEKFSISDITGLEKALQNKLGINHASDENAHLNTLAKLDASNLNDEQKEVWKEALGVGSIPDNVALVDLGESPEVFNKNQIRAMAMMIADYTVGGKIRADKIEALGLTDLIEASENTLAAFVVNSGNYEFQKNDFVAIPDVNGNYSLFIFKGGNKSVIGNYLPTGLTKITMAMVEGLQSALDGKIGKPTQNGSFFAKNTNGLTSWQNINAGASYLLFWDGENFKNSSIFREASGNKFGVGTASPTEQLHLTGRARMSALVLDDNSETLPNQITKNGNRYYGSNSSAIKRGLMYNDFEDFLSTFQGFTTAQALNLAQILGGGTGSPGNPSVNLISPPIVQNQYDSIEYILLQGANLNLGINRKVEILASDKTTVIAVIPDNQIQTYDNGLQLIFFYNFHDFPMGQYFIRLTSGAKVFVTSLDLTVVNQVNNIDLSAITWEFNEVNPNPNNTALGANVVLNTPVLNDGSIVPSLCVKSSEIFAQGEDFYIELNVNISEKWHFANPATSHIGLGYSNTPNILAITSLIYMKYNWTEENRINTFNNDTIGLGSVYSPKIIFIKTGNLFRTIIGNSNVSKTISNNSGYSLFFNIVNRGAAQQIQSQIIKAFKFN
ncbi:hypothetical protein [Chryseobacterium sp.]|uniref:hypothetical protein n=1 Tax=Chryseobacterium sp. TaxID=1871047 RepID=UPI00289D384D|nr:hypothetical protein [Chryseobacterium sp.]